MKNKWIISFLVLSICLCSFIFAGCNEKIVDHEIQVTSQNGNLGRVEGRGTYKTKDEVTITAIPNNEANQFILWMKNGFVISYENPYKFKANNETEGKYTAVFESENQDLMSLTGINYNESFIEETNVSKIKSLNIYIDNKEYYQTLNKKIENLEINTELLDGNPYVNYEISEITPEYVLNYFNTIYIKIEITYVKIIEDGKTELEYIKTTNKTINPNINEDGTISLPNEVPIKLNSIADSVNLDETPELILSFSILQKQLEENSEENSEEIK